MNRYYAILSKRAHALGSNNEPGRKALYAQVRAQLDKMIDAADPPMSTYQRLMQMQALETAIADVEAEVRRTNAAAEEKRAAAARRAQEQREQAAKGDPSATGGDTGHAQTAGSSTPMPPRQGRKVEEILEDDPDAQLSPGLIIVIIGSLFLLMLIGVVIALDPSSFDLLGQNPATPDQQ